MMNYTTYIKPNATFLTVHCDCGIIQNVYFAFCFFMLFSNVYNSTVKWHSR